MEVSDVLAEPAKPRSIDVVWFYSVVGFESARVWTYRCLSLLFAVPFALLLGIFLAVLACLHVWYAGAIKMLPRVVVHIVSERVMFTHSSHTIVQLLSASGAQRLRLVTTNIKRCLVTSQ